MLTLLLLASSVLMFFFYILKHFFITFLTTITADIYNGSRFKFILEQIIKFWPPNKILFCRNLSSLCFFVFMHSDFYDSLYSPQTLTSTRTHTHTHTYTHTHTHTYTHAHIHTRIFLGEINLEGVCNQQVEIRNNTKKMTLLDFISSTRSDHF